MTEQKCPQYEKECKEYIDHDSSACKVCEWFDGYKAGQDRMRGEKEKEYETTLSCLLACSVEDVVTVQDIQTVFRRMLAHRQ